MLKACAQTRRRGSQRHMAVQARRPSTTQTKPTSRGRLGPSRAGHNEGGSQSRQTVDIGCRRQLQPSGDDAADARMHSESETTARTNYFLPWARQVILQAVVHVQRRQAVPSGDHTQSILQARRRPWHHALVVRVQELGPVLLQPLHTNIPIGVILVNPSSDKVIIIIIDNRNAQS